MFTQTKLTKLFTIITLSVICALGVYAQEKDVWEQERISDILTTGNIEALFKLTRAPMTERPVYYHICKLYVDGEFKKETAIVKLDKWFKLYSGPLRVNE